ncbi:SLC13 family permease [Kordiimonas pumila]|uniref:SLC13 family permease n=1 Tax=Kordiimonas pumila TaxID=2161677 RepID=A0ABV7D8G3_9PROT|nr:SLC13 family permease [Kordiimonas pumila]
MENIRMLYYGREYLALGNIMENVTIDIIIVLVLVCVVFFGFIREKLTPDVVAMGAVVILLLTGILDTSELLKVFSSSAPVTVGAMFVLSAALDRTGAIDSMGRMVAKTASTSTILATGALMLGVMVFSAFINNTPVVVILTPVVISLARAMKIAPSKLLIPLSFACIFGGTTTLIGTSTNILVDGVAQRNGIAPFGVFEITLLGLIMGGIGISYMLFVGRWLLPNRETLASMLPTGLDRKFMAEVLIPLNSPLIGQTIKAAGFTAVRGFQVIDLIREDLSLRYDMEVTPIKAGDRLVIRSKVRDMIGLREAGDVAFGGKGKAHPIEPIATKETTIVESIVGPDSASIGRRVKDLGWRRTYGVYVLAIHRHGQNLGLDFADVRLRVGDSLLIEGTAGGINRLFDSGEIINLSTPTERPYRRTKAPIAFGAVLLVMGLAAFEVLPIAGLAIIAAVMVVLLGCLESDEAYGAIQWNILFLIFGMLALGTAMEKTGTAKLVVDGFAGLIGGLGPVAVLSAVYLITSMLTEVMSNNAAAILITPLAIGLAHQLGVDPRPFVVAVMFAASASFATPIGYQTNTFVYNAGGYKFMDFVKIGVPLNIIFWIAATVFIPMLWPL